MAGQRLYDRALIHGRKRLRALAAGLTPAGLRARAVGPRVLLNSIPKAGTNLLERALDLMPGLRGSGVRTLRGWDTVDPATLRAIGRIGRGQYATAHLPAHPAVAEAVRRRGIRALLMVRDPRDVAVSHHKYVTAIDLTHPAHRAMAELPDDDARLRVAIAGRAGVVSPIRETLEKFAPWLGDPQVLVVRFEDLVGPSGGGDPQAQARTVAAIARHLGIGLDPEGVARVCAHAFSSRSPTFRSGAVQGWRAHYKPEHRELFKQLAGDLLIRFGYEQDLDW